MSRILGFRDSGARWNIEVSVVPGVALLQDQPEARLVHLASRPEIG